MAEDEAYESRKRKEKAAEECITAVLDGIKAFFDGKATIHLSQQQQPGGLGQSIRFIKDPPKNGDQSA